MAQTSIELTRAQSLTVIALFGIFWIAAWLLGIAAALTLAEFGAGLRGPL